MRMLDLFLSERHRTHILSLIEDWTLRISYLKPIDLFAKVARPHIGNIVSALFVLVTFPLYRSVVVPLVRFDTGAESVAFIAAAFYSFISIKWAGRYTSSALLGLGGQPERDEGAPFTVGQFARRFALVLATYSARFLFQTGCAYAALWLVINIWLEAPVDILRFSLATGWPWIYYFLSVLPITLLVVAAALLQTIMRLLFVASKYVLWKSIEYRGGPIPFLVTMFAILAAVAGLLAWQF